MRPCVSGSQTTVPDTNDNVEDIAHPTGDTDKKSAEQETAIRFQKHHRMTQMDWEPKTLLTPLNKC